MRLRYIIGITAAAALLATSCGGTTAPSTTEPLSAGAGASSSTSSTTTTAAPQESTTTAGPTTTVFDRFVDLLEEPPPFEEVAITTEDDVELYAKYWEGSSETAVLFGHDFDNPTPGALGQRAAQSSDAVILFSGVVADQGWTVLSPDFRGHGQSGGEYNVKESQLDLKAAYNWLVAEGYTSIIMVGWVGSGTAAAVLDASDVDVNFSGIAMIFSPLQDTGLDAQRAITDLNIPSYFIGIDTGSSARAARFLERAAVNPLGITVFDGVPSGLQFIDVHGPELAGRLLQFLDDATA
ncbi:MAG: hypothetical protein HKN91_02565 [Acidimicrobiia bacterium]|nr:hypothetical protein [Acidimicrobiia bacterium]